MSKECECGVCQKLAETRPQRPSQIADKPMLKRLYKATTNTSQQAADAVLERIWCDWPTS